MIGIKAEAERLVGLLPAHRFRNRAGAGVMTFEPSGKPEEYLAIDHETVGEVRRGGFSCPLETQPTSRN